MAILLLAGLLVLAASMFVVWHAATTGDRVDTPAISTNRDGGSSVARDPNVDRHAQLPARYHNTLAGGAAGSRLARYPAIERHAEVVARYNQDNPR
jgi:hypothetical protein